MWEFVINNKHGTKLQYHKQNTVMQIRVVSRFYLHQGCWRENTLFKSIYKLTTLETVKIISYKTC